MRMSAVAVALIGLLVLAGSGRGDQKSQPSPAETGTTFIAENFVDLLAKEDFVSAVARFDATM